MTVVQAQPGKRNKNGIRNFPETFEQNAKFYRGTALDEALESQQLSVFCHFLVTLFLSYFSFQFSTGGLQDAPYGQPFGYQTCWRLSTNALGPVAHSLVTISGNHALSNPGQNCVIVKIWPTVAIS